MNRRVLGVVLAVLLAAGGTWVLVRYVQNADERALADQETVEVYVVTEGIPQGTAAESIVDKVSLDLIPAGVVAEGAISDLSLIRGRVAAVDLVRGEQVVASRFITPEVLVEQAQVDVPDGLLEVTFTVTPERAVGSDLRPGDLVAVIASFDPFTLDAVEPTETGSLSEFLDLPTDEDRRPVALKTPNTTHITVHKALVTRIQMATLPTAASTQTQDGVNRTPSGSTLVTVAVEAPDVEKIVFAAEWGAIWLAREQENSSEAGTQVVTRGNVYR